MDDWDGPDLGPLTAGVDHSASRALFDTRRRRHRRRRRVEAGALVALLVFGGALAVAAATGGDRATRVATAPPEGPTSTAAPASPEVAFRVVAQRPAAEDDVGQLRAATDAAGLEALWAEIGFEGEPPSVDLVQDLVVSITIPDDACPPELVEFRRDGDQLTPVFEQPTGGCDEPLIPKTYVVAIERASVAPAFVLHLPADPTHGFADQHLSVVVDPNRAGAATSEVVVELIDVPLVIEGFDYAVRFRGRDGSILVERRLADFAAGPDAGGPPAGASVSDTLRVPAGPVVVDSHLTVGIGPGPGRPDFETGSAAGSLLCPSRDLILDAGASIRLSLDWETGCLERSG